MNLICGCIVALVLAGGPSQHTGCDATFSRIIANAPSNAEIVCALGACDKLVGVSRYATYPTEVKDLPKLGGLDDPDLEAMLALRPDLVIQRGGNPHVERMCEQQQIVLYIDRTDSLPSLFTTIDELGGLLGRTEEAANLAKSLRDRLDAVRAKAPKHRPRVLLVLRSPDRLAPLTTVGKPSYLSSVIELAGGDNVFGNVDVAYPQIGLEEVIAARPDVILDVMPGEEIDDTRRAALLKQWQAVASVPAVQSDEVHILTEDYVLIPSPRVVLLAEKLNRLFANQNPGRQTGAQSEPRP
ncbi:MAG: ABC transporter substrate-binding protein [Phycisphaerales bacterium]|nr:ABC transporter substrate-binding protein [Phycisphaerales bacterium]